MFKIIIISIILIFVLILTLVMITKMEGYTPPPPLSKSDAYTQYLQSRSQPSSQKYDFLIGPISLSYHTHPKLPQKIYIFGDRHLKDVKCPTPFKDNEDNLIGITDFLVGLTSLKNTDGTPKLLDYFFEIPIDQKFNPFQFTPRGFLGDIYTQFKNCLKINKDECLYKNVRIHYSDARFGIQEYQTLSDFYSLLLDWNVSPQMDISDENVKGFWEGLTIFFENPEIILESSKIDKQINDADPIFKDFLQALKKVVIKLFKELNDKVRIIYNFTLEPSKRRETDILPYWKKYSTAMQGLMDLYLFARMFRKFSRERDVFGGSPRNIIIYAGEKHSETYRSWLSLLGFDLENYSSSEEKEVNFQCLDISNFKQPFFS